MCTPSQKCPFGSLSIVIASSKSRACSPSIVTVGTSRKSVRPRMSRSDTVGPEAHRFGDRLGGVRVGNAVLADDDLGVDAGRVDVAEHLGDAADGAARVEVGHRVSSTVTISPGDAPPSWPGGMKMSISTRRSNGTT